MPRSRPFLTKACRLVHIAVENELVNSDGNNGSFAVATGAISPEFLRFPQKIFGCPLGLHRVGSVWFVFWCRDRHRRTAWHPASATLRRHTGRVSTAILALGASPHLPLPIATASLTSESLLIPKQRLSSSGVRSVPSRSN